MQIIVHTSDRTLGHELGRACGANQPVPLASLGDLSAALEAEPRTCLLTDGAALDSLWRIQEGLVDELRRTLFPVAVLSGSADPLYPQAIDSACFGVLPRAEIEAQLPALIQRIARPFPQEPCGDVYVIGGPKAVGKSAMINFLARFVPGFTQVGKYSSRAVAPRDAVLGGTLPLDRLVGEPRDNIFWESYGNMNVIARSEVDEVCARGLDACLACGYPEGAESTRRYYPDCEVFVITSSPARLAETLARRKTDPVGIQKVEHCVAAFEASPFQKIQNDDFFRAAWQIRDAIRERREASARS